MRGPPLELRSDGHYRPGVLGVALWGPSNQLADSVFLSARIPMDDRTEVLVVGGGPTGLLLAAELCRRGVGCRLIDDHPAPLHWDRATVVHPRSLEIFETLGILDPLLAAGVRQRFARLHSAGAVLGEIDLALCGSRYGYNIGISEEVTERILTDYLQQHGGEVVRAAKLLGIEDQGERLVATIDRDGESESVRADWIVGCDGIHSTTRTLTGIELAGHDITEPWAVFDTTLDGWSDSYEANYAYLDDVPVILTALPGRRWRVYLRPSSPESDLVADAKITLERYLANFEFTAVENPTRFHCHTRVATKYRAGRILLAGDAAHVCSPAQGHGMNSGLQDAFNLAWKLALVCQGHASPSLLDSYEAERRPVAEMITASGDEFEQSQAIADPTARRERDAALRAVFSDASSRHHEAIAEAELDIDYSASPIVMGERHPVLAPGQRLPDTVAVTHRDGTPAALHELICRQKHTAIVVGGPATTASSLGSCERLLREASLPCFMKDGACVVVGDGGEASVQLTPAGAELLGADGLTLLVIRPDGHVGLRAERDHAAALARYQALLATGE